MTVASLLALVAPALAGAPPIPSPDPMGLPAPLPILRALSYLTLTLHLLAMHFTLGGLALLLWARLRGGAHAESYGRYFAVALPLGFSYLVTFGVPPLLFVQVLYGQLFYSTSVIVGAAWILVVPALILAYGGLYLHKLTRARRPALQGPVLVASLVLMLAVGFIYVTNFTLVEAPARWLPKYAAHPGGASLHLDEPTLWPRLLLFLLPCLAAAGVGLGLRAAVQARLGDADGARASSALGARAAVAGVLLGLAASALLIARAPAASRSFLVGGGVGTALAAGAAVLALVSAGLALAGASRPGLRTSLPAALALAGAVACVVAARDLHRAHVLAPSFRLADVPVHAQYGMLGLFVVALALGLAVLLLLLVRVSRGLVAGATRPDATRA